MTNEALQAALDDATTRAKMKKVIPLTHVADCTLVAEAQKELNMR
jgi:hypothetical protein